MLVVTANWAVADGTLVTRPRRDQAEWLAAVHRAAIRAGAHRDGRYAPLAGLDVVLAGDTLDGLTTTAWLGDARPWHAGRRAEGVAAGVLAAAAARCRRLCGGLARWAREGIPVPDADRRGRPDWSRRRRVPVRVTVLPGDRDRWLTAATPRLARRGIRVAAAWSAGTVAVCHGAEFEPSFTAAGGPEVGRPSLGESLAVDLVARFAAAIRAADVWPECRGLVAGLAAARPRDLPLTVTTWLATATPVAARAVRDRWARAVSWWRRAARTAEPACGVDFDPVDAVAAWLESGAPACGTAALDGLFDPGPPPPPPRGTVVLGHPPAAWSAGRLVCLGGQPAAATAAELSSGVAVSCIEPAPPAGGPAHVVCTEPPEYGAWMPLMPAGTTAGRMPPAFRAAADEPRIVEAA
jgi:hypothetical protein